MRRVLDAIVPTTLLCRRPNESKTLRRTGGSPLAAEYCDTELARDGTDGRDDTGEVLVSNSVGVGGAGTFFARGMITGRSSDEGSTELRSGDDLVPESAYGCGSDGGGGREDDDARVETGGAGGTGGALLPCAGVTDDMRRPALLDGGEGVDVGVRVRELGVGVGEDGVCILLPNTARCGDLGGVGGAGVVGARSRACM